MDYPDHVGSHSNASELKRPHTIVSKKPAALTLPDPLSSFAQVVADQPLKTQRLIIKIVIHDYPNVDRKSTFEERIVLLTSLIGCHPLVDQYLTEIIQELTFNRHIFSTSHFERFEEFVIENSLKIKLLSSYLDTHNKVVSDFLQLGCHGYWTQYKEGISSDHETDSIRFATSVSFPLELLDSMLSIIRRKSFLS
ncbi:unnamed protein product [Ambrosiozyma monospora]|uniref:Unnamed protein product n=1 Tax=Ambrosiozyma monospora TaxID=43982 RepID=A0ACB5SW42_AMBMO|nr:unnamed protein product [Ambrosiozyma monospora]